MKPYGVDFVPLPLDWANLRHRPNSWSKISRARGWKAHQGIEEDGADSIDGWYAMRFHLCTELLNGKWAEWIDLIPSSINFDDVGNHWTRVRPTEHWTRKGYQ